MKKKLCVITGATSGIGWEAAHQIAAKNCDLIVVGRNEASGNDLKKSIQRQSPTCDFKYFTADLSNMQAVKEVVAQIRKVTEQIDILINNAGGVFSEFALTEIGVEKTLANNHLSYFVFTQGLLDLLLKSEDGRLIIVSSGSHYKVGMDFDTFMSSKKYNIMRAYAQSKLANLMFAYKLTRLLEGTNISTFVLHPGFVKTPIGNKSKNAFHRFAWKVFSFINQRNQILPDESAKTYTYLATERECRAHNGLYFHQGVIKKSSAISYDETYQEKLWKWSEEITGVHYNFPISVETPTEE
jgi:NAD(P)-dependent dehydrogenase (short-subunit alcohol dehydrogenase family)